MKKEKWILLGIVMLLIQLVACERSKMDAGSPSPKSLRTSADSAQNFRYITTEKTVGIKLKEPAVFTLINPVSEFVKWRVSPKETVINGGVSATVYFQNPGNYRVFAIDSLSSDTTFINVLVTDEPYIAPSYEQDFLADEEIQLTPVSSPDSANFLEFRTITKGNYNCLNNSLVVTRNKIGDVYEIDIKGVTVGHYCQTGEQQAKSNTWIDHDFPENVSTQLEMTFNGKTYKGSFKKTGVKFEFTWPYDSGIIFTTKSL